MRPDPPIYAQPREISPDCACRWGNVTRPGGTMRLAEIGRRCQVHNPPTSEDGMGDAYKRKRGCPCLWVPTGKGWDRRLVEIAPGCVYHASVTLGAKDVAPWR